MFLNVGPRCHEPAKSDGAPLIAITGQVGTERMHLTSHQYLDLVELFAPITKRSKQIVNPNSVNEIVRIAFKYAESEKPGACHVDLPTNVAKLPVSSGIAARPLKKPERDKENASFSSIDQSETIGIPQKDYQNKVLDMADLVIAVGYDIVEFAPGKWNGEGKHKIIHIDQRPAHINMLYQPEVEVVGDISYSLQQIQYRSDAKEEPEEFLKLREEMVAEYESYADDTSFPMKPQKILYDVRKFMGADDIVISDVGAHKMWIAREYNCYEPNTCIISNGFATMGIAVPGAVAAKLIYPEKKVLAISGDGGFMMNSQEYETALREGTPIVTLIFSDASYGLIKWKQMDHFGHNCFVDFQNPDFVKYAESMHAKGYRVEKAEDLLPILEDAFQQKVPCIIDCPVDYSENTKLSEYLHDKFEK